MSKKPSKKIKPSLGDVFQISLPDGRYAYGRVYDDASVGIYRAVSDEPLLPPIGSGDFLFHVGMYDDVLKVGMCPIVGRDPFRDGEEAWPPPYYIIDPISGEYSLYHKGEIKPASAGECEGLEEAAVWELRDIITRVMRELGTSETAK
ncbi:MAG: Imm26 family immunity protein [Pyrinomonadaceae bacterium]